MSVVESPPSRNVPSGRDLAEEMLKNVRGEGLSELETIRQCLGRLQSLERVITLDEYAAALDYAGPGAYGNLTDDMLRMESALRDNSPELLGLYNRFLVLRLLQDFDLNEAICVLPDTILRLYPRNFGRIFSQVKKFEDDFFSLENDAFLKDIAILSHRLIPVGAEYALPQCGMPRSVLFSGGSLQFVRGLWFTVVSSHGFRPFFSLHAHTLDLEEFTPTGWDMTYERIAELLQLNLDVKGFISSSWFLDPALECISPHLTYLREVPCAHGAVLFRIGLDKDGKSGALAKSVTRRTLFAKGEYVPCIYTRAWARRDILLWVQNRSPD